MARVQHFYEFVQRHLTQAPTEFLSEVQTPHLYFSNLPDLEPCEAYFQTVSVKPGTPPNLGQQAIAPVRKGTNSNAFAGMITLGRAKNNDVVVPDRRVSKFHAYLKQEGSGWTLTDANSSNGSVVDDMAATPEQPVQLNSGSKLILADAIQILFLEGMELYRLLQEARTWV